MNCAGKGHTRFSEEVAEHLCHNCSAVCRSEKAEEDLKKLHNMSDVTVFKELSSLLDPSTTTAHAHTVCVGFLPYVQALLSFFQEW
jgi:hypothetical protein